MSEATSVALAISATRPPFSCLVVLYSSQGLFYFKVADTQLMSAIFRAYNDWLAEFCSTDPERLKGIAMINLDEVQDGIKELERTAKIGFAGAMITEYPPDQSRSGKEFFA